MTQTYQIDAFPTSASALKAVKVRKEIMKLPNGLSLNVTEWLGENAGNPNRSTIVLIHGLGDSACVWRDVAIPLAARFRVLGVDLRGHGDSGWALDGNYETDTMADDIACLFRLLDLGRVTVVGHSLGAAVALRFTAAHSCDALILGDFGLEAEPAHVSHLLHALRDAHRAHPSVEAYASVLAERHPVASADLLQWIAAETTFRSSPGDIRLKYDPAILTWREGRSALEPNLDNAKNWNLLTKLRCPVLVLRGVASSVLSAKVAEKMVRAISLQGMLANISAAGHSIHVDNPKAVAEAVHDFLNNNGAAIAGDMRPLSA